MNVFIYPYKVGSNSVNGLKAGLDAKTIKLENSKFKGKDKLVINWGNSNTREELNGAVVLNNPEAVAIASNKLDFFKIVQGHVTIPEYTTDKDKAEEWFKQSGCIIIREVLTGHSGKGIQYIDCIEEWEDYNHHKAKMYVKYVPKKDE